MLMPEAPMDKYHFASRRKHEVRLSWQVFAMKPEAIAEAMDQAAKCKLRACILAADPPHIGATAFWRNLIHTANG
jgi:hypothetical protein